MKKIHILCTLLFGVAVLLFFGLAYPQHLHYQEQFQLFLFDSTYVWDVVKLPGGVADLLGRFCTQFFLYAWVGALIIAVLLTAVQLLTLRLASWGRLYALSFVPSFLLWLFLLDENALLGGVWAVLLTLLASWAFDALPRNGWLRHVLLIVAIPVLYWMVGPVCLVFFLLQAPHLKRTQQVPLAKNAVWSPQKSRSCCGLRLCRSSYSHSWPETSNLKPQTSNLKPQTSSFSCWWLSLWGRSFGKTAISRPKR